MYLALTHLDRWMDSVQRRSYHWENAVSRRISVKTRMPTVRQKFVLMPPGVSVGLSTTTALNVVVSVSLSLPTPW